jgi:predicted O-methyltransferase YrrM
MLSDHVNHAELVASVVTLLSRGGIIYVDDTIQGVVPTGPGGPGV